MMGVACIRIGRLLHRDREALPDADRLQLERHLTSCSRCRKRADAVSNLVQVVISAARPRLTTTEHEAVIARALSTTDNHTKAAVVARMPRWQRPLFATATAALALGLLLWVLPGPAQRTAQVDSSSQRVLSGLLDSSLGSLSERDNIPSQQRLKARETTTVVLAQAAVVVSAHSEIEWDHLERRLDLHSGSVDVDVTRRSGESFSVATPRFEVQVLGTQFRVDQSSVVVHRGSVRIVSAQGEVLVETLRAGGRWQLSPVSRLSDAESSEQPRTEKAQPRTQPDDSASDLLDRARTALSNGATARANRLASAALELEPTRFEAAEARTILAEVAQATGNRQKAITLYLEVARRYPNLLAGETALFAAARLEANAGNDQVAIRLLKRYLSRYRSGVMRSEASRRLRALSDGEDN